jgi:hypothetical protein
MGYERRLFTRTDVEVQGSLQWATKRRTGGIKQHEIQMTTVDLSVNGARLVVDGKTPLPVGASCRISFAGESSPARVRTVQTNEAGKKLLSVQLENASVGFMQVIDEWISQRENGWQFDDSEWFGSGVPDDHFADKSS